MIRQLSYAMKNLLQAPKTPSNFLPFAVSSWHKDSLTSLQKESIMMI